MATNYFGYLFVYFIGEEATGEQVYFSLSQDGLHWKDLNQGKPVLYSNVGEKGVRDPFIVRGIDAYHIIGTDLRIASEKGWDVAQLAGSRSVVVWTSKDLIHWEPEQLVELDLPEAGCVWAPEAIYMEEEAAFLMFWASKVKEVGDVESKHRIYCALTKDFKTFTKPKKYIERENHIIDTTIVKEGDYYYRISKDESTKNIKMDRCTNLLEGPFEPVKAPALEEIFGVEGPAAFKFNNEDKWCLMIDQFATNGGYLPLVTKQLSSGDFKVLPKDAYDLGETKKRHGSLLNITEQEYKALIEKYS